jgi:hypothetical protein
MKAEGLDSLFTECLEAIERDERTEPGVTHELVLILTPKQMERARFEALQRKLKARHCALDVSGLLVVGD